MTPQELKASILQLAIQGKLVEQRAEEGSAASLLPTSSVADIADDVPYDIPETWEWCRLEDVATLYNGRAYKKNEMLSSGKYPLLRVGNLFTNNEWYYSDLELGPEKYCEDGDLLYAWSASFGPHIWHGEKVIYHYHIWKLELRFPEMRDYLYWALEAQTERIKKSGHGSTMIHVTKENTEKMLLPLPPLAEQKRIVAKIEELLPYIDRYEQAWSRLEDFNRRFPVDMQKSILQMAIHGKLVEQRPEEGTGEALFKLLKPYHAALRPCKDELDFSSMDFDLPESWVMAELNQLFDFVDYRGKTPTKITEGIFLVTASNIRQGYMDYTRKEYISPEEYETRKSRGLTERGDLLFTTEAPMGNAALCDLDECSCGQRIITFKAYREHTVFPKLFMYFILSPQFQQQLLDNCTGTTAKGIKADKLKHFLIPLPPLAEQKRIVAKLEEMLPLCDRFNEDKRYERNDAGAITAEGRYI